MNSIRAALIEHSAFEGRVDAIRIAEEWQASLEAMIEVADKTEQVMLAHLLSTVDAAIRELL